MVVKMVEQFWLFYKIKLGIDYDFEIIEVLWVKMDVVFCIDVNIVWIVE